MYRLFIYFSLEKYGSEQDISMYLFVTCLYRDTMQAQSWAIEGLQVLLRGTTVALRQPRDLSS